MPEKSPAANSKMSPNKCSCCPYGFHIDRDFVRYCDSLYNSAQLDKLRQHKRERRKEKKSVESYLGLGNLPLDGNNWTSKLVPRRNSITHVSEQSPKEFCFQSDDLRNAVNDFEDTWKKSLKKSYSNNVIDSRNGIKQPENLSPSSTDAPSSTPLFSTVNCDDTKESKLLNIHPTPSRSSSLSSVSSQSTSLSHTGMTPTDEFCNSFVSGFNASLSSLSKPLNSVPQQTVGIHKSVLTNIREQMASSLLRMKELEEQVKVIPALKGKLSALYEEKKSLLNELKLKERIITEVNDSKGNNELANILKKLENEGIMSPTLSRKCLSVQKKSDSLSSPAIAFSLDATMVKKNFIEREIISQLKMNDVQGTPDKKKKSIGTSCTVLTREIGVGYVPNKYKSVGVGNDLSLNESLSMLKKANFENQTSMSSESLESDIDSLSGTIDISKYSAKCSEKLLNDTSVSRNVHKLLVDSSTNTNISYIDKCIMTESENKQDSRNKTLEKSVRHKSVSVSPTVSNKYMQTLNKCTVKSIGLQTLSEDGKKDRENMKYARTVGVGDFVISDILCDSCKKLKKTIGVGDFDVKMINCDKCQSSKTISHSKHKSIAVGDYDIHKCCEKCQLQGKLNVNNISVGVNTTVDLSSSDRDIRICDKCSETIHSVAQDLAADSVEGSSSKLNAKDTKVKIPKTKLSKHKTEIQPLKIKETKVEMNWSSTASTITKEETSGAKSLIKNSSEVKGEKINISEDTESTIAESPCSEILPNFTDLPVLPKKKRELSKEIKAACKVLNDHLKKSDRCGEKQMLSSLNLVKQDWFKVANLKKADPHLIEDYLDAFEEFSKLLLHKIVNLSDDNGNTALHYAVSYGNFDVVSILIDSKVCDVNIRNKAGYTSIMLVALADIRNDTHHYVVQRLFSIGDINAKASQNGQTALMLAVSHGKKEIVKILLDVGAEINLQDKDGSTALMCAAEHGYLDIAKILLSHSECDPTIVDNDGCNALTIAMETGHKDIGLLIYTNMNFSRGNSPFSTLKNRKRSTPRSTPPPHTPTLRTPPLPSPATKSMNSLSSFQFPN